MLESSRPVSLRPPRGFPASHARPSIDALDERRLKVNLRCAGSHPRVARARRRMHRPTPAPMIDRTNARRRSSRRSARLTQADAMAANDPSLADSGEVEGPRRSARGRSLGAFHAERRPPRPASRWASPCITACSHARVTASQRRAFCHGLAGRLSRSRDRPAHRSRHPLRVTARGNSDRALRDRCDLPPRPPEGGRPPRRLAPG